MLERMERSAFSYTVKLLTRVETRTLVTMAGEKSTTYLSNHILYIKNIIKFLEMIGDQPLVK